MTSKSIQVIKVVNGILCFNATKRIFSTTLKCNFLKYTTKTSTSISMVDHLVNSLGFSKQEAIATSSKVSHLKSTQNLDSFVGYLIQSGLNKTQIKNLIFSAPKIITHKFDETLKPKLKVFQELGFCGPDLADFIAVNRQVWGKSLNAHILPSIQLLKTVVSCDENLLRALKQSPWLLWNSVHKCLPKNVDLLQSYGLSVEKIEELLLAKPRYFVMEPNRLQNVLEKVEGAFGITRDSPMFPLVVTVVASLSEKTLESKLQVFRSFGWTDSDILWLVKTNPRCLNFSKETLRRKLNFFVKDIGCDPDRIVARPVVLNYSIEKRVIPRCAVLNVLKNKGLSTYNLIPCLCLTEFLFLKKFVLPFEEEVRSLYENHKKNTCSLLPAAK